MFTSPVACLLVPNLPTCTAPSACGATSCVVPRGVSGICGLRAVWVAPSQRQRGTGPARRLRRHPRRQRRCTSLSARDPPRFRFVPVVIAKVTLIGQIRWREQTSAWTLGRNLDAFTLPHRGRPYNQLGQKAATAFRRRWFSDERQGTGRGKGPRFYAPLSVGRDGEAQRLPW